MNVTERYLRAIFEAVPTALSYQKIVVDNKAVPVDFEFIDINQAMEELFAIKKSELIGKRFSDLFPVINVTAADWLKTVGKLGKADENSTVDIHARLRQKCLHITLFTVGGSYCAARYNELAGDKRLKNEMDDFFTINLELLCVTDLQGLFIKANKEFEHTLGYQRTEWGKMNFLSMVHTDDRAATHIIMKDLAADKHVMRSFINRCRHKDGSYRYLDWRARYAGEYMYASARDITEKIQAEISLKQQNNELVSLTAYLHAANEKLKMLVITDELTGLYNRHYFDQRIIEAVAQADRNKEPVSLIIFDLDHFKAVNDTWGHPVGDKVLKQTAKLAKACVRNLDVLCRVGGEEFAVIMPQTVLGDAMVVAEKLREALDTNHYPQVGKVTGSFGVVERAKTESVRHWYKRTDDALYQAKSQGRNRVVAYSQATRPIATIQLKWREEWICGNTQIDEQHQEMVKRAAGLFAMLYANEDFAKMLDQLDALLLQIADHFKTEEQIQAEAGYPDVGQHVKAHEDLVKKALYLKECYQKGELNAAAFFSFIIDDVVMDHMIREDVKFFPYLKQM